MAGSSFVLGPSRSFASVCRQFRDSAGSPPVNMAREASDFGHKPLAGFDNSPHEYAPSPQNRTRGMNEDRLPDALLAALAALGNARSFRANAILISEGDAGD